MLVSIFEAPDLEGEQEQDQKYTRKLLGESNSIYDREPHILKSPLCPKRGQRDPWDPTAVIVAIRARPIDPGEPGNLWIIEYNSTTAYQEPDINPLEMEADIEWNTSTEEGFTYTNSEGKPIVNTAGDLIGSPLDVSSWVIQVTKNVANPNPAWLNLNDTVNKGTFQIDGLNVPAKKLACKNLRLSRKNREKIAGRVIVYRTLSYELHYRREGWFKLIPNVGFNKLVVKMVELYVPDGYYYDTHSRPPKRFPKRRLVRDPITKQPKKVPEVTKERIRMKDGELASEPQPLDKDGFWIDTSDPDFTPNKLVFKKEDVYPAVDWNGILPTR